MAQLQPYDYAEQHLKQLNSSRSTLSASPAKVFFSSFKMSNLHILLHKISRRPRGVHRRLDCLISVVTKGWWTDRQLESCVLSKASAVVVWLATIESCVLSKVVLWLATIALLGVEKHPGEIVVAPMMDYLIWSPLPTPVFLIRKSLRSKPTCFQLFSCSHVAKPSRWRRRRSPAEAEAPTCCCLSHLSWQCCCHESSSQE